MCITQKGMGRAHSQGLSDNVNSADKFIAGTQAAA